MKLFGFDISRPKNATPLPSIVSGTEIFTSMSSGAGSSYSGKSVTERSALCVSAVYASVALIAGAITSMPLHVYRRSQEGRERVDNDVWTFLNVQPRAEWSAAAFFEYLTMSLLLHGDAFAKIDRAPGRREGGRIIGFSPAHPSNVEVKNDAGRNVYKFSIYGGGSETVDQDDVLHVPGLGYDGRRGISQLSAALKNSAGNAIAADEYAGKYFANNALPDVALTTSGNLTEEQADLLRKTWVERYGGSSNAHLPAVLTGGLTVQPITINAEDSQLLQTRQFQVEDIARVFGVPPFMIGHNEKTTSWGSGVEQMSIGFVKYTLRRHLTKIEQEVDRKCFTGKDSNLFCQFLTAGLERGDLKTRYDAHRVALGRAGEPGFITVNEVRKIEDLPPIDGGDKLFGESLDDK